MAGVAEGRARVRPLYSNLGFLQSRLDVKIYPREHSIDLYLGKPAG